MMELLREWRVEVVRREGESEEDARENLGRVLREEKYFNVSAHSRRPEECAGGFLKMARRRCRSGWE
jgi:hypothetical protein